MSRRMSSVRLWVTLMVAPAFAFVFVSTLGLAALPEPEPATSTAKPAKKKPKLKPAIVRPASSESPEAAPVPPAPVPVPPEPASPAVAVPAAVPEAACPQDRIDKLVHGLTGWVTELQGNERRLYVDRGCDEPNVICLDRQGDLSSDKLPARATAGRLLSVYAILPSTDRGRVSILTSVKGNTAQSQAADDTELPNGTPVAASDLACPLATFQKDAIKTAAMPIARLGAQAGLESLDVPANSWTDSYWATSSDSKILGDWLYWADQRAVPSFTAIRTRLDVPAGDVLSVDFTRTERGSHTPSIEKHYDLVIDNGRYYVEPALLVPFVYRGSRSIELVPTVTDTELAIEVRKDWHVTAAAMLDVFPLGRQKGQMSSFRDCRYRSCIENWLGAQVGFGLDSTFQDWYLGIVFQPVSGLSFNAGGALLKGEFLAPGRAVGMLLPSPDASIKYSDYMVRPYFGITLSLDILEVLDRGANSARRLLF